MNNHTFLLTPQRRVTLGKVEKQVHETYILRATMSVQILQAPFSLQSITVCMPLAGWTRKLQEHPALFLLAAMTSNIPSKKILHTLPLMTRSREWLFYLTTQPTASMTMLTLALSPVKSRRVGLELAGVALLWKQPLPNEKAFIHTNTSLHAVGQCM